MTLKHPVTRQVMLRTTFDYQEKQYDDATYLNGHDFSLNIHTTIDLGPDKALFLINGGTRSKTRLDHNDYWSGYAGPGYYRSGRLASRPTLKADSATTITTATIPTNPHPGGTNASPSLHLSPSATGTSWGLLQRSNIQ